MNLERFEEAKALLRRTVPVARRVLGEGHEDTLRMRVTLAESLYCDAAATLDDIREAKTSLEDVERTARRVLGSAHPLTVAFGDALRAARAALRARKTQSPARA